MSAGLCQNPECGAVMDAPGAPHRDRYPPRGTVLLCDACTAFFAGQDEPRYELVKADS